MGKHEHRFHHGHAHKLDDPERRTWLPPDEVIARVELRPGMNVADIGAGTGYFALPMATAVSPGGHVAAVDVQPEMLAVLRERVPEGAPIALVEGEATRTTLADASQDVVFAANVWHEIDDRGAALTELARIARPGGRLAILDFRVDAERPPGPPPELRIAASDVAAEVAASGSFQAVTAELIGRYSYLVLATRVEQHA
ncbi:Methyltransferase [Minicystis rosea]|nr:Methyltransferase [Minicystis rosea]